jgi:hypothetical protein
MKNTCLVALACMAVSTAAMANPFSQFKGKMKEGLYEYKMEMDMGQVPGMPPGMGKQSHTMQNCVTNKDIEGGGFSKGRDRQPENCDVKNFNMSGNTATYQMVCKGAQPMTADNRITFSDGGFKMDMKMAMQQGGQLMNMTQRMEGRYIGPCKQ